MCPSPMTAMMASLLLATATATCGPGLTGSGCTPCPANTYKDIAASTAACIACTSNSGTNSATGQTAFTDCLCNPGYTGPNGGACIACGRGKFKAGIGSAVCTDCGAGKYKSELAQVSDSCNTCPTNSDSPVGSQELINCRCNAGSSGEDGGVCTLCPLGSFKSSDGDAACTECVAGKQKSTVGDTVPCDFCAAGKYQNMVAQPHCLGCPAGKFHNGATGQTSVNVCASCPDGQYSYVGMTACHVCPKGQAGTAGVCTQCLPGQFQDETGQTACKICPAGQFLSETGSQIDHCTECWSGKNALSGWGTCCGAGEILVNAGDLQCTSCARGKHQAEMAKTTCTDCGAGKFSSGLGASVCQDCGAGQYTAETAAAACELCAPGKYLNATGSMASSACVSCGVGLAANNSGNIDSTSCLPCAAGHHADNTGSADCAMCPRGKHSSTYNFQSCETGFSSVSAVVAVGEHDPSSNFSSARANLSFIMQGAEEILTLVKVERFIFEVKLAKPIVTAGKEAAINVSFIAVEVNGQASGQNPDLVDFNELTIDSLQLGSDYFLSLRLSQFTGTRKTGGELDKMLQGGLNFSDPVHVMMPSVTAVLSSSMALIGTVMSLWVCTLAAQAFIAREQRKKYVFDKLSVFRSCLAVICLTITLIYAARFTSAESGMSSSDVAAFVYCGLAVPVFEVLIYAVLYGFKKAPDSEHKYKQMPSFTRWEIQNGAAVFSLFCSWCQFIALSFLPTLPWFGTEAGKAEVWNSTTVPNIVLFQMPSWYGVVFSVVFAFIFFLLYVASQNEGLEPWTRFQGSKTSLISQLRSVAMPVLSMALFLPIVVGLLGVFDCAYYNGRPYHCVGWNGLLCWLSTGHWVEVFVVSLVLMLYTMLSIPCQFQYQSKDIDDHGLQLYQSPDFCIWMSFIKYIMGVSTWFAHYIVAYSVILFFSNLMFLILIVSRQSLDWGNWPTQSKPLNVTIRVGMWISFFCSLCALVSAGIDDASRPDAWITLAILISCVVPIEFFLMPLIKKQGELMLIKETGLTAALEKEYRACLLELPRLRAELQTHSEAMKQHDIVVWEVQTQNAALNANYKHDMKEWEEAKSEHADAMIKHQTECDQLRQDFDTKKQKLEKDLEDAKQRHDIETADRLTNELLKLTLHLPKEPKQPAKPADPKLQELPVAPRGPEAQEVWKVLSEKCTTLVTNIDSHKGTLIQAQDYKAARLAEKCQSEIEHIKSECQPNIEPRSDRPSSILLENSSSQSPVANRRPSMNPNARSPTIRAASSLIGNDFLKQLVQEAKEKFVQYDHDDSGTIDQNELKQLLSDMDIQSEDDLFDGADLPQDGYDLQAFLDIYAKLAVKQSAV